MKVSHRGLLAIEGREGVRLKAYRDSKGLPTIGVGHLIVPGDGYSMSSRITQAECDALFAKDIQVYENAVNKAVNVPLAQNQFDALVSVCLNIGTGGFTKSTIVKRLNAKNYSGAAEAIMFWKKPSEIIGRRKTEQKQFLTPYPKVSAATQLLTDSPSQKPLTDTQSATTANSEQPPTTTPDVPQAPNQTIVDVPPVVTEVADEQPKGIKGLIATVLGFVTALGSGFFSLFQGLGPVITISFFASAALIASVYMFLRYRANENDKARKNAADEAQKDRDFELTKLQLQSAMDPNKQTVRVAPPAVIVPQVEAPE